MLAYSGDTGPCPQLVDLAKGADLLLAEAAFRDGAVNPIDLHLTGAEAASAAAEAGVGRLVLTHIPPWHDAAAYDEAPRSSTARSTSPRAGATYDL